MASPTTIAVETDDSEYSRFEAERSTVGYTVSVTGASMVGEEVIVEFVKARRNRDVVVAYATLTLDQAGAASYSGEFNLVDMVDTSGVPKVRRGSYFIRAVSESDDSISGESEDFIVSLVTVDRLRSEYLFGLDLKSTEMLGALEQPKLITGITITEVSVGHSQDWITMTYSIVDAGGGSFVRTLSWCGGPQVKLVSGTRFYIIRRGSSSDWIRVKLSTILDLPATSISEEIFVTSQDITDARVRAILEQAISWIEDVELFVFLEPTVVITEPADGTDVVGTDIPAFVNADWDEVVNAVTYQAPSANHWINFKLPYKPLIRFEELYGVVSNARVITMDTDWVKVHEKTGFVDMMPFNQSAAFNFMGLYWVQSIRGNINLPNFWNFEALCGFRDLPQILLELVAKKAAIDMLIIAGTAKRAGISSQSVSRDGVSESVSYTASATASTYSATINDYKKFIEDGLKHFRGAFSGPRLTVV